MFPPKLVNIVADYLFGLLASIINSAIIQSIFPSKAKKVLTKSVETTNIHFHTIVSVLNTFPTFIELEVLMKLLYVFMSFYELLWEHIVSIMESNMCLFLYSRNDEIT